MACLFLAIEAFSSPTFACMSPPAWPHSDMTKRPARQARVTPSAPAFILAGEPNRKCCFIFVPSLFFLGRSWSLLRARGGPIAGFAASRQSAFHSVAVDGAGVVDAGARGDVEFNVIAVDRAVDGAGLARAFEGAGDFRPILLDDDGLVGVSGIASDFEIPGAGNVGDIRRSGNTRDENKNGEERSGLHLLISHKILRKLGTEPARQKMSNRCPRKEFEWISVENAVRINGRRPPQWGAAYLRRAGRGNRFLENSKGDTSIDSGARRGINSAHRSWQEARASSGREPFRREQTANAGREGAPDLSGCGGASFSCRSSVCNCCWQRGGAGCVGGIPRSIDPGNRAGRGPAK